MMAHVHLLLESLIYSDSNEAAVEEVFFGLEINPQHYPHSIIPASSTKAF
jgi:hypothetical protein